jgi:hypothetical protein
VHEIGLEGIAAQRSVLVSNATGGLAGGTFVANATSFMSGTGRIGSIAEDLNAAAKTLKFTVQMGTANLNASMTVLGYVLERIRPQP